LEAGMIQADRQTDMNKLTAAFRDLNRTRLNTEFCLHSAIVSFT
jgi:hypothetical protein